MLSEHVIERYEVQERQPKGTMSPALHNTDLEQKKPRRKDTPALHMSPFAAGKRAGAGHLQGVVGTGQEHYHLEVPQAWPVSWPSSLCHTEVLWGGAAFTAVFRFTPVGRFPRADTEMERESEHSSCFSKTGQIS